MERASHFRGERRQIRRAYIVPTRSKRRQKLSVVELLHIDVLEEPPRIARKRLVHA
jgi:hypothetical protein